jgi:hypothetical protein
MNVIKKKKGIYTSIIESITIQGVELWDVNRHSHRKLLVTEKSI